MVVVRSSSSCSIQSSLSIRSTGDVYNFHFGDEIKEKKKKKKIVGDNQIN